jgi:dihydrofolate reductase
MAELAIIAALAANRVIGIENHLPWHLPEDLQHFKALTLGKPILMGRKTYESIGRPLPGRRNIVITRNPDWSALHIETVHSLEAALALVADAPEIMLIGGAELYQQGLARADRLYLTELADAYAGDAFFPEVNPADWREIQRQPQQAGNGLQFSYVTYERITTKRQPG